MRRALWMANIVLLVLLGYLVADTVAGGLGAGREGEKEKERVSRKAARTVAEPVGMVGSAAILNRNVFGVHVRSRRERQEETTSRATPAPAPAPPSLRLKLLGTVVADASLARALILNEASGTQGIYALGETVQGARLERIEPHAVHLVRGSREEVLELKFRGGKASPGRGASATAARASTEEMHKHGPSAARKLRRAQKIIRSATSLREAR